MTIGATSPYWRRFLLAAFSKFYFRRSFSNENGEASLYVSPGSSLTVLRTNLQIDKVHQRFIRDWINAESVVWDIGANVGLFAFPAALKARRGVVYAFEPDIDITRNLLRSTMLPLNEGVDIRPMPIALSDRDGVAAFEISRFSRAMNKLEANGRWHQAQIAVQEKRWVPTMKVDTLAATLAGPSVMKIDVEGAEMNVLHGAVQTIAKNRPPILIEGPRELWDEMATFFRQMDYRMFDGSADGYRPLDHPVWDTFALPIEKAP